MTDSIQVYDGHGNPPGFLPQIHLDLTHLKIEHGLPSDTQEQDRSGAKRIAALRIVGMDEDMLTYITEHLDIPTTVFSVLDDQFAHAFLGAELKSCMQMRLDMYVVTVAYDSYDFSRKSAFPDGHRFA